MTKQVYVGIDGKARKIKKIYIGVNGIAREVKAAYVGVDNLARLCYKKGPHNLLCGTKVYVSENLKVGS